MVVNNFIDLIYTIREETVSFDFSTQSQLIYRNYVAQVWKKSRLRAVLRKVDPT